MGRRGGAYYDEDDLYDGYDDYDDDYYEEEGAGPAEVGRVAIGCEWAPAPGLPQST